MQFGISFQDLAFGPFDSEKVEAVFGLSYLDRLHDVGMFYPGTILCLTDKTGYCGLILA